MFTGLAFWTAVVLAAAPADPVYPGAGEPGRVSAGVGEPGRVSAGSRPGELPSLTRAGSPANSVYPGAGEPARVSAGVGEPGRVSAGSRPGELPSLTRAGSPTVPVYPGAGEPARVSAGVGEPGRVSAGSRPGELPSLTRAGSPTVPVYPGAGEPGRVSAGSRPGELPSLTRAGSPVDPGASWTEKPPAAVGLDPAGLAAFCTVVEGRGCVVRHGVMAYTWGNPKQRGEVASAVKPVLAHFLLKAVEEGRLASLDTPVVTFEPRLADINPDLGHKDRRITFRQMIFQTSCYGVSEAPGTAFDYNDWQMALLADTLFTKVWATTYERVNAEVAGPWLFDRIGCQDHPQFSTAQASGHRAGRLSISVRDFARFGLLYLHEGQWAGQSLLARETARRAVTSPLPGSFPRTKARAAAMIPGQRSHGSLNLPDDQTDHLGSYSFAWWTNGVDRDGQQNWPGVPVDAFGALGHGGRRAVVVVPSLDLVTSWNDSPIVDRAKQAEALRRLVRSVADPAR